MDTNHKDNDSTNSSSPVPEVGKRKYLSGPLKQDAAPEPEDDRKEEKPQGTGGRRYLQPRTLQKNKKIVLETQLIDISKAREKKNDFPANAGEEPAMISLSGNRDIPGAGGDAPRSEKGEEQLSPGSGLSTQAVQGLAAVPVTEIYPDLNDQSISEIREAAKRGQYSLLEPFAKGAESILYKARAGNYTFCVKAIRNRWDNWIGNSKTKNNQEKLQDVAYTTKIRHLRNEYDVAKALYSTQDEMPVVKVIYLRKVTRIGLELGYDLLMEYIQGHDLSDRNLLKKLSVDDKIRLAYQATLALQYLHKRKMIHLDIKPSNFMLTRTGKIRLIDFGISVLCGFRGRSITGTTGYHSPEQVAKETLNEATDIFALGVTFSIFFGGKPLLQNQNELLQRSVRRDARFHLESGDVSAIAEMPELSEKPLIAEIIRNCSILKRENRIPNCQSLLQQLQNAAKNYGLNLE